MGKFLHDLKDRIIPADAGSTSPWPGHRTRRWDHPRGCGEHKEITCELVGLAGSSPRMRGARLRVVTSLVGSGIIPADAGSTLDRVLIITGIWDHPRRCGEHDYG